MCAHTLSCFSHVPLFVTPMDCSSPGSSVQEIFQARIQNWVTMSSSRGSFRPRIQPKSALQADSLLTEPPGKTRFIQNDIKIYFCLPSLFAGHAPGPSSATLLSKDFPGRPVVKTLCFQWGDTGSIPYWGAKIPHASRQKSQNIK